MDNLLDGQPDAITVLKAIYPYGLVSKTLISLASDLSPQSATTTLARLEKLGMIVEQTVAKIEKKGRPEKIYRLTEAGAAWLQDNGIAKASVLGMSDPVDLTHRYCQALVGVLSPDHSEVEIEKVIPLTGGRNIRIDIVVSLSSGVMQFVEIEQKLDRKNIHRAIEKFRELGEVFRAEQLHTPYNTDVLFVFNLNSSALPRTLNVWCEALAHAFPNDMPIPFTPRYTTMDVFMSNPSFSNLDRYEAISRRVKYRTNDEPYAKGDGILDYRKAPSTTKLLEKFKAIKAEHAPLISHDPDQLIGFCETAMTIYKLSMDKNSPARRYSAFPQESVMGLREYLHMPENAVLMQALKDGSNWIESRKSGLILYREAVTRLVWDVFLRYFGFGRVGPLNVFVGIPDLAEKSSQITIDVILNKSEDLRSPSSSVDIPYEEAISWMLTALIMYPVDLGLASSLWLQTNRKGGG